MNKFSKVKSRQLNKPKFVDVLLTLFRTTGRRIGGSRAKTLIALSAMAGLVLAIFMNVGVTPLPANANNCQVGSSSACPATSPQEIFNLYGTTTNGVYWLRVDGVAREAYVVMNTGSSWGSGYWILLMKGARGTSNFGYSNANFTSNSSTLNTASPTPNFTSDAKYHAYNGLPLSQMMAVIASPANGTISNQGDVPNNSFGGHTWVESAGGNTAHNRLTTNVSLNSPSGSNTFASVPVQKYTHTSSINSTQVFSYQTGTGIYGYNVSCGTGYKARWGIIWNNETNNTSSCDAFVGIGGSTGSSDLSPRDYVSYVDSLTYTPTGINRTAPTGLGEVAFQIWGKMANPSLTAPSAPSITNLSLDQVRVDWAVPAGSPTDYIVQYKLTSDGSWGTNPTQSVVVGTNTATISGLSSSTSYDFRVIARTSTNSSDPSNATSFTIVPRTISFNSNSGEGSMSSITVANGVGTTLPGNSFSRSGFTFRGWNTLASGTGTNYTDGATVSTTSDLTLYAMWTSLEDRALDLPGTLASTLSGPSGVVPSGEFTVEAWIYMRNNSSRTLFSEGTSTSAVYLSTFSDGRFYVRWGRSESAVSTTAPLNRWIHVALSRNSSGTPQFILDGVQQTITGGSNSTDAPDSNGPFRVGVQIGDGSLFNGQVDQIKVWNKQLTAAQLAVSMHSHGSVGPDGNAIRSDATLRAHYDFNAFSSGRIELNRSGSNYNLTYGNDISTGYFTDDEIVETGTAHSHQSFIKFHRSYLTAAGGWTKPSNVSRLKALAVAGGGGGGAPADNTGWRAGGGGAGGLLQFQSMTLTSVTRVTVGLGGFGGIGGSQTGGLKAPTSGQDTVLGTVTAKGGGRGGTSVPTGTAFPPESGGSGGGGGMYKDGRASALGAAGTTGQGFAGGDGNASGFGGGGGGGAGGAGGSPTASGTGGNGGAGLALNITGSSVNYAWGGTGAGGATEGDGVNWNTSTRTSGESGLPNSGAGGDGGEHHSTNSVNVLAGSGGSGVVVLSYGPVLEVTRTATSARVGSIFSQPIQVSLRDQFGGAFSGGEHDITVSAPIGILQLNGVDITQTTVRTVSGVATFTGLGFKSTVSSTQTLTFTSDSFVGTTLDIVPSFTASAINITSSGSTDGTFKAGAFESSTSGTANILNTDLQNAMLSGSVVVESAGTISVQANVSSSTSNSGLTLKAVGRISTTGGSSGSYRTITTAGGPITLWTTGSTGGVTLGNFTQLNTTQSGASGADITIGGGAASSADANRPSGSAKDSGASGVSLGTSSAASVVVMRAGQGSISISGEHTTVSSTTLSGIAMYQGNDLLGQTINIRGVSASNVNGNTSAGLMAYYNSTEKTVLEATGSFGSDTPALQIYGESASLYGALLGPSTTSAHAITLRASGDQAGVAVTGTTARASSFGLWLGGLTIETKNGSTLLDSGDDIATIGKDSNRPFTYRPTAGGLGGDITIRLGTYDSSSTTIANINTAGVLSYLPSGSSFSASQVFPTSGSSLSVGGLIVGTANNTADLTVGATVTSASEVTYRGGSITVSANVTSSNGTAAFYATGASKTFSKTTATISAAQSVIISSASSSVDAGSGAISASNIRITPSTTYVGSAPLTASNGVIQISGGSAVTLTGALQATGNISISGSGNFSNSTTLTSSAGNVSVTTSGSATATVTGNIQATNGSIAFSTGGAYSGAGTLTAGTTVSVTSAGVTIGGNVVAGGNVTYTSTGSLTQNANVTSNTGNVSMNISGANAIYSKNSASTIAASQEASITSAASTVNTTGTGTISAGTVRLASSSTMTSNAPITSRGTVEISSSAGDTTVSGTVSAAGNTSVVGGTVAVSSAITTTAGGNLTISPRAGYSGAGALTAAGTLTLSGGTTVTPTGSIRASSNITITGSGIVTLNGITVQSTSGQVSISAGSAAGNTLVVQNSIISATTERIRLSATSTTEQGIFIHSGSRLITTSGDIEIVGSGADWGVYFQAAEVLSASGDITIDGGTGGIVAGHNSTTTTFGATTSGTASGDITVRGNRYWNGTHIARFKTTGNVVIESSTSAFSGDVTLSNHTFSSHTTLRIGTSTNNRAVTLSGTGSVSIVGDYQVYGSAITQNTAASSATGNITFTGSGAFANSGALNAGSGLYITGASTITATGAWTTNSALDVSATGNISTNNVSAITVNSGYLSLVSSGGTVTIADAITVPGEVTITGTDVTTSDSISAGGVTLLTATSSTGDLTVDGNVTVTGVGNELILKSKRSVINSAAATIRTNYAPMVFWADSDGNSTGVNRTAAGSVFNTVNGSTSDTVTGGGDMIFAGGSATDANGYPTGFAFSDGTYSGFHSGTGTCAKTYYYTGGGDFIARGYTTGAMDAVSTNCSIQLWANAGQIVIDGQSSSNGLGIQLQRGVNTTQSEIFSSSNAAPAIKFTALSNTGLGFVSGNNQSTANRVMIQATGTGGVLIDGNGGAQDVFDVGLNSTNILSNGPITINGQGSGWNGGLFTSSLFFNHNGTQSTLGYCAASTCTGSRVTSSSADVSITVNRVTSWAADTNLKVNTSGEVSFVPTDAQGFHEFKVSGSQGLAFSSDVSGLTIGKDQSTNTYTGYNHEIYLAIRIAGPIRIYSQHLNIRSNLETTGPNSEIRIKTTGRIYVDSSVALKTAGGDVVLWTGASKQAGTNLPNTNVYLNSSSSITTNGGKIWLAGGLDDGGADALITSSRGKWDSVVAGDGLPDGYALGHSDNSVWDIGVFMDTGVQLKSGGGDIFMAGALGLTSTTGYGHVHLNTGTVVDSGSGRIAMWGRSLGSAATNGIVFHWGNNGSPTIISSNAPTSDAITIYSDSSAGSTWSRGITGIWYAAYSSARGYQGTQILATASGGGITMTGIGANAGNDDSKGIWLDFTDVMAIDGPITLNGDSNNSNKWGVGVAFGWEENGSNAIRLGGWHAGPTGTSGGGVITTPGGATADFRNSSADVTINTDSFYTRETGVYGVFFGTTGDIAILPADRSSGLISATSNFEFNHNENALRFGNLNFPIIPSSITIGRSDTTSQLTPVSALTATGEISITGGVLTTSQAISGGTVRLTSNTGSSTIGASVTAGAGGASVISGSDINVNAGISAGASVLFKASRDILVNSTAKTISSSNGGNLIFWGNSSGTGGEVDTGGTNVAINSNGGDIVIGGGADDGSNGGSVNDGIPDNYLLGRNVASLASTARLRASMSSGAGDITVRAQHFSGSTTDALAAVYVAPSVQITSSTGDILIEGKQNSGNTSSGNQYGVWLGNSGTWSQRAIISSASGNVVINGDASQSQADNRRGIVLIGVEISAGSNIELTGGSPSNAGSYDLIGWQPSTITAAGDINVSGARTSGLELTTFNASGTTTLSVGNLIGGDLGAGTSSATSVPTTFAGSGAVVIQPYGSSFTSTQTMDVMRISSTVTRLTIGKTGNTAGISVSASYSIAGDIEVIGGAISVSGNQTTTNSGNITITPSGTYGGAGTLTSAGSLTISGGTTVDPIAAISAANDVTITGSGAVNTTSSPITSNSGDIRITSTGSSTNIQANLSAAGALEIKSQGSGSLLTLNANAITTSSVERLLLQSSSSITVGTNRTIQTSGSDLVLWSGSTGGSGYVSVGTGACLNTNASCDTNASVATGDIVIGGGASGVSRPTGPSNSTSTNGVVLGAFSTGGATLLSGGGDISISGSSSAAQGVRIFHSSRIESKTGSINITGSTSASNLTALIVDGTLANSSTTITSGRTTGTAIRLTGIRTGNTGRTLVLADRPVTVSATAGGDVHLSGNGGSLETGSNAVVSATLGNVSVESDTVFLGGQFVAPSGIVTLSPITTSRDIKLAASRDNSVLSVLPAEIERISADTLRITNSGTGDITFSAGVNLTGKVNNLAIRAGNDVTAASGVAVVVANLGIEAGGTIDWPGTGGEASVVALNASSVTFNQSANYSVATVDGIDPEFGLGVKFVVENIDRTNTVDRFMAVTFNPPPVVKIQDKFGNVLAANNLSAANYTVSASMSVIRTDTPTPTLTGTVATRSGGTHSYDTMRVIDGTGKVSISFTVERSDGFDLAYAESSSSPQATSVAAVYEVKAGFPSSIVVSMQSSAQAGKTGLNPTATLKDSGGGTLTTGDYANATITVAVSTDTQRISIVSGGSAQASNGVASFSNLIVGGLTGSNYVLTFSVQYRDANGVTQTVTRDSGTFTLNAGEATALSLNSSSQTVANRATLSDIVVGLKDAYGNTTASLSNVPISLAVSNGVNRGLTPTLVGYSSPVNATTPSSTATFSGLELQGKVDSYDLVFSSTGLSSAVHRVELTHGEASALIVSAPTTADNDRTFGSDVVVDIVDPDENVVTTGSQSTQTISLSATTTLTGTRAISATAGRATFSGLKLLGTVGTKTLTASISQPSAITKNASIQLGFGEATKLVLTTEAAGIANRTAFSTAPVITVQDSSGNTVTNYSSPITVSSAAVGSSGPATLTGTLSRTASSGVATFSGLELQGKVGDYLLSFNSTRSDSTALASVSQQVRLTHGVATNVLVSAPATASNNRELSSAVSVQIRDQDNNVVLSSAQEITLAVANATLSGTVARLANQGVASFPALTITGTEGTKRITATVTGTALSGFADVELGYGQATRLAISQAASGAVSRELFTTQPVIKVLDVSGNEVDDFAGEVNVSISGVGTVLSGTTSRLVSGATVTYTDLVLRGPVDSYTLLFEATESGTNRAITQTSQNLYLAHGEATQVIIDSVNTVANAADLGTVTVEIKDADGNLITTGTPEVELSITGSTGSTTLTGTRTANANSGTATFTGLSILGLEENKTLTAAVSSLGVSGTKTIALTYGSATQLALVSGVTESANRQAFAADSVIEVRDSSGNPVDNFVGDVTVVASSGSGVVSGTLTRSVSSARATFNDLSLVGTTGSYVLTFSSTGVSSVTQSVEVAHGVATTLELEVSPNAVNNQTITDVVVRIKDANGNLVTTGTPSVSLEASAAELTGTLVRNAVSGVATFTGLKFLGTTGTKSVNASLDSPALNAITSYVTVSAGEATEIVLTTSATGAVNRAGISTVPVLTIRDISGNTVVDSTATVAVSVSPAGATLSGTTSRTPVNGVVSFAGLGLNGQVGQYTLTFESTGLSSVTQTIDLTHGAAVKLAIGTSATTARAGMGFGTQPVIRILDEDNNLVTTGASSGATVAAALTGSPAGVVLAGDLDKEAVGGIATFTDLRLNGEVGTYNIEYSSGALQVVDQDLELLAGNVTALRIATGPANAIAGAGFASDVEVELVDAYQNVVLSDSTTDVTATLVASSDVSSRGVTTATVRVVNGVADFASLNYTLAGEHKISFSDGTRQIVSGSFTITHAEAAKLAWVTQPGLMRNDIVVGTAPSVRVLDDYNNPVLSGPSVTVIATVTGANSGDISNISGNSNSTSSGSEVVTLSSLKLKGKVSDYVIRMTGSAGGASFFIDSDPVALSFGLPSQIVITEEADGARAGVAFDTQPELEIRDNSDNLVADSTLRVTATVSGRTLVGTSSVSASGGVVSFADLGIQGSAATGLVIRYATSYSGNTLEDTQTIDLTAGDAVKLSILQQPETVMTREEFDSDIQVQLLDQYDNPVPTDSLSQVSVELYKGLSRALATGGSVLTLTAERASSGVATFNGLTLPVEPGTDYFLKFSLAGFTITSSQFEVLPGVATRMVITQQPSSLSGSDLMKTGELLPVQPEVTLYDADNYIARGASGNVTVSIASGTGGSLTEGVTTATISNGVARFSGVKLVGTPRQGSVTAQVYRLSFSHTPAGGSAVTSDPSNELSVTNNNAVSLTLIRGAADGQAGEVFDQQPIVHIVDRYGNIVETGTDAALVVRATSPDGGTVLGANRAASKGVARFATLSLGGQVNRDYTLVFSVLEKPSLTNASQTGVRVSYGFIDRISIRQAPASLSGADLTKTGSALAVQPIIEVHDAYSNVVENASLPISVTLVRVGASLDAKDRVINGNMTTVNGVASFSGLSVVARPGENYHLRFATPGLPPVSTQDIAGYSPLVVRHADPSLLEIVRQPASVSADASRTKTGSPLAVQPKLRLLDFDGNLATEINTEAVTAVVISETGGRVVTDGGINQAVFSGGIATFNNLSVVAVPSSEQVLRFSTTVRGNTLTSVNSSGFSLTFADAYQLAVLQAPCAGAVLAGVCDVGVTGEDLTVQPVIEIQDRFGNRVTDYVGQVTVQTVISGAVLRDSARQVVSSVSVNVSGGLASFGVAGAPSLNLVATPGVDVELSFTSGSLLSATSDPIRVRAAQASQFVVITQPVAGRTGSTLPVVPVIELRDEFGNRVLSDDVTRVSVASMAGPLQPGGTVTGETTVTATAGRATFTGIGFIGTPKANYTLRFTANDVDGNPIQAIESGQFFAINAEAAKINIAQTGTTGRTGDLIGETVVELLDAFDNLAEDNSSTVVRVSIVGGTAGSTRFVNAGDQTLNTVEATVSGGVVRFTDLRVVGLPGESLRLRFDAASHEPAFTAPFVLTHGLAASLSVTRNPVADLSGVALTTQPQLALFDRYGNAATTDNETVVTASIYSGAGGALTAGATATAVNGIVTFSGLTATGNPGTTYLLRFSASTFAVDDLVGFRVKKNAVTTLSYAETSFVQDGPVSPSFATDSDGAGSKSFATSTPAICSVDSSTGVATMKAVGDCVITVTIPTTVNYYSLAPVTATLKIIKAAQPPISITTTLEVDHMGTLALSYTGSRGTGAVIYSVNGDCRVIGSTLLAGAAGSLCEVRVERRGDSNYLPSISDWSEVTINKVDQEALVIGNATSVIGGSVELFTWGGSGNGAVTFFTDPSQTQCSISASGTLNRTTSGNCDVYAIKAESAYYLEERSGIKTFSFSKLAQTISFTSAVPDRSTVGQTYAPVAVASSNLSVSYTISSGSGTICSVATASPFSVRFNGPGICEITATQSGDATYDSVSATQILSVGLRNQTITFAAFTESMVFGTPSFMLTATASSGLPVSYTVSGNGSAACAVTNGRVSLTRSGMCVITASQPGNLTEFAPATPVTQVLTVTPDKAGAPHLVSIGVGDRSITAKFTAPGYLGGSAISAYRMEAKNNSTTYANFACDATPGTACTITGLPRNTIGSFEVRVAAITEAGIGTYSDWSRPIDFREAGLAVRNLVAPISGDVLRLAWDAPMITDGFSSYEIYVWPQSVLTRPSATAATVRNVNAGGINLNLVDLPETTTGLQIEVVTVVSPPSTLSELQRTAIAKTIGFTTPSAPARIALSDMEEELLVAWSPPLQDGGQPIMGYQVFVNDELSCSHDITVTAQTCRDADAMSFTVTDLQPGTEYKIQVAAMNSLGLGELRTIFHSTPAPPSAGGSSGIIDGFPGLPVRPGKPGKPGSGNNGPNVLDPDSWNPGESDNSDTPLVPPAKPIDPSGPDSNAQGQGQAQGFEWLPWLVGGMLLAAMVSAIARRRRLRRVRSSNLVSDMG